jgi:hypothetical protein
MYAFADALESKDRDDALVEMLCAAGDYDLDLSAFVDEANPRLQALLDAVNEASGCSERRPPTSRKRRND